MVFGHSGEEQIKLFRGGEWGVKYRLKKGFFLGGGAIFLVLCLNLPNFSVTIGGGQFYVSHLSGVGDHFFGCPGEGGYSPPFPLLAHLWF